MMTILDMTQKDLLSYLDRQISKNKELLIKYPLVLFGASQMASHIYNTSMCWEKVKFIVDETFSKQGTVYHGISVVSFQDVYDSFFSNDFICVVSIFSSRVAFNEIKSRIVKSYGLDPAKVLSFWDLSLVYPEVLPYYSFSNPLVLFNEWSTLKNNLVLCDQESRNCIEENYNLRILGSYVSFKQSDYLFDIFSNIRVSKLLVYIDGGAYDGDTIDSFLIQFPRFEHIYAFEPDRINFDKLKSKFAAGGNSKITLLKFPLWSSTQCIKFSSHGTESSSISSQGEEIAAVSLDEYFGNLIDKYIMVKFDLEGADYSALQGSKDFIQRLKPILVLSVYHGPSDVLDMWRFLEGLLPKFYKYMCRSYGADGTDFILYALPPWVFEPD